MTRNPVPDIARAWILAALLVPAVLGGEDLAKLYPATMEWSESGLATASDPADVWQLASFELGLGKELRIAGKKAALVLGRHETNVLWAIVFPEEAVTIDTKLAGDGEMTSAIFLRFSPYDLGRLFPSKTVKGPGPAWLRARADRIFRRKIGWRWCTPAGNSTIVPRERSIVDADTASGARRFYFVDRQAGSVEYVSEFEAQPLPALAVHHVHGPALGQRRGPLRRRRAVRRRRQERASVLRLRAQCRAVPGWLPVRHGPDPAHARAELGRRGDPLQRRVLLRLQRLAAVGT